MYREIDPGTFERTWRSTHDSVFSGRPAHQRPFRNSRWEMFLVPYGLNMSQEVFNGVALGAKQAGDQELIIMNAEVLIPEPAAASEWIYSALDEVRCTTLGHFEAHLFGRSALWGVVCSVDDFSCIGGEATFMNTVASALGGRSAIQARFSRFAAEEWHVTEDFRHEVLQKVGWT